MSKTRAISSAGLDLELRPVRAGEAERLRAVRRSTEQPEEAARVNAMWVAAEARGGGLGVALCEACAEWASARGFKRLILATYATNEPALRVYRTAGFAVSGPEEIGRTGRAYVNMVRPL
jgi:GNAT superfamily N-acetyltransferase